MERIPTGIEGLDEMLGGGIIAGETVLMEGPPGCGKTTFGLQFIHQGITRNNENGLVITFEQFPEQICRDALNFGWDFHKLEQQDRVRIMCTSPEVLSQLLHQPDSLLDRFVAQVGAKRVFLDSISHLESLGDVREDMRGAVNGLLNSLKGRGFTTLVSKEAQNPNGDEESFEAYIVDAVIRLGNSLDAYNLKRNRTVEILKARGQNHATGRHPFKFGPQGIIVYPLHSVSRMAAETEAKPKRISTGIEGLDHLFTGGVQSRSSLLLAGGPGTGKTICGLQFLFAGATQYREKGILFSYEQTPGEILGVARSFGWHADKLQKSGKLILSHRYFTDINIDEHLWEIKNLVRETGAIRLVFDSLTALLHPVSEHRYLVTEKVSELVRLTKSLNCTVFFICAVPSGSDQISAYGIEESLVDGVILLRTSREHVRRKRSIEICKARGVDHVMGERRMAITAKGIQVYYRTPEMKRDEHDE